ncbi:hypothetical protein IWX49DRAFT_581655 [Phyllosticta citricarpa]
MMLKTTTVLFGLGALLTGTNASPVAVGPDSEADVFYVWSDSSRCDPADPLDIKITGSSNGVAKGTVQSNPDIVGQQLPTGELQFKLQAPFVGNYVVSRKRGQPYPSPEIKIELSAKGTQPAGKATYSPGWIPAELDRISWTPDPNVKDQKVLKPSLDYVAQLGEPKQGKEETITTNTYADALWIVWVCNEQMYFVGKVYTDFAKCSGERARALKTNLRTRLTGEFSIF